MLDRAANNFLARLSTEHHDPRLHAPTQRLDSILAVARATSIAIEQENSRWSPHVTVQEVSHGLEAPQHVEPILDGEQAGGGIAQETVSTY